MIQAARFHHRVSTGILLLLSATIGFYTGQDAMAQSAPMNDAELKKQAEAVVAALEDFGIRLEENNSDLANSRARLFYQNKDWMAWKSQGRKNEWRQVAMYVQATAEESKQRGDEWFEAPAIRQAKPRSIDIGTCGRAAIVPWISGEVRGALFCGNIHLSFSWKRHWEHEPGVRQEEVYEGLKAGEQPLAEDLGKLIPRIAESLCRQDLCAGATTASGNAKPRMPGKPTPTRSVATTGMPNTIPAPAMRKVRGSSPTIMMAADCLCRRSVANSRSRTAISWLSRPGTAPAGIPLAFLKVRSSPYCSIFQAGMWMPQQ